MTVPPFRIQKFLIPYHIIFEIIVLCVSYILLWESNEGFGEVKLLKDVLFLERDVFCLEVYGSTRTC